VPGGPARAARLSTWAALAAAALLALTVRAGRARAPDPTPAPALQPSAWWLGALPEGVEKRQFILDCTGCHQFNETRVFADGALRGVERWSEDTRRMLSFAGAASGFPVIAADRTPEATAAWLTHHLTAAAVAPGARPWALDSVRAAASVREHDLPVAQDLPHDVAIDREGRVLVTGMFTHAIYRLEPSTGTFETHPIPVPGANPRAIEVDAAGDWWVLLGQPKRMARHRPATGRWDTWEIGAYPHSVAVAPDGRSVWFNGHFSRDPEEIGRLDTATGTVERFAVPPHPTLARSGGPLPYELRLAPNGWVWMSELQGNRVVGFDPARRSFRVHEMPRPWSGPRRFDVDRQGRLWIPAYAGNALVRLDPETSEFREFPLPASDCLPYVVRADPRTGSLWIGTAAADAVLRFDPESERFTAFALPTRGATLRHLAIDAATGRLWLAYGASPALHPARIASLEVLAP
jgi:virginiamycin B lyase